MVDISEFTGEAALRTSLIKKRDKANEKLMAAIAKAQEKILPLTAQVEKYDALIAVLGEGPRSVNVSGVIQEDFSAELTVTDINTTQEDSSDE